MSVESYERRQKDLLSQLSQKEEAYNKLKVESN
jgi:hypothetical protein